MDEGESTRISYSTISSFFGRVYKLEEVGNLYGSMPSLVYTIGTRAWSSTIPLGPAFTGHALTFGNTGGVDIMRAIGEPDSLAFTLGHQRPALSH